MSEPVVQRRSSSRWRGARFYLLAIAVMLFLGLEFTANTGDRPLFGRTGPIHGSP